jgi:hypothetical protein
MSIHTRSTQRHIPENGILHSHRRENLKSYKITSVSSMGEPGESQDVRLSWTEKHYVQSEK